jgi:zona occludens toxin (predicted ATPase)
MLQELQSLNPEKKKSLLIVATIIIMVIVIGVWLSYFNSILQGPAEQAAAQASSTADGTAPAATTSIAITAATAPAAVPAATPATNGPGLWQDIKNGFGNMFRSIANIFQKPSQYNIQPQGN